MNSYVLADIAKNLGLDFSGPSDLKVTGIASLADARPGQISFLENPKYKKYLQQTQASAVIVSKENAALCKIPVLISPNPYLTFAKVAQLFDTRPLPQIGIHATAIVGQDCKIHPKARIGAYCVIGDGSVIGADSCLWPHVTIYDGTQIGERTIIHSGAVIGSDGFGNARDGARWFKVPQLGRVVIGNDVEIGANTTIDRGALDDTIIEDGVRLDNQIQVAHNVKIGAHTAIASGTAIAGSTTIGKHCLIAGGAGIGGHIQIADQTIITGMTNVSKNITEPGIYSSATIAQKNLEWRKMTVHLRHLDELFERVKQLEALVEKKDE